MTYSKFDSLAKMLSLVVEPGPLIRPPLAAPPGANSGKVVGPAGD
jgi:hypothetical protein